MRHRSWPILLCCGLFSLWSAAPILQADVIRLKNGGEVRGVMDRAAASRADEPLDIVSLTGIRLRIDREEVEFYVFRSPRVEEYETRAKRAVPTVEAQWELAQWCARNRLIDQHKTHLHRVIELSPDHPAARKLLDHVQHKGEWLPREEMMRQKGYVKYQNRYISMQEMALLEELEQKVVMSQEWLDQMKRWRAALYGKSNQKTQAALQEMQALRDPAAVPALVQLFGHHSDPSARKLMLEILSAIDAPSAKEALATQALFDESRQLRQLALQSIPPAYHSAASQFFVVHLSHTQNQIINRAAVGLQHLGTPESLPALIGALVTSHSYTIHIPVREGVTFGANGSSANSSNLPPQIEALARAGQLPYGVQINQPLGMPTQAGVTWKPMKIRQSVRNEAVLVALEKLTDEHFGYDQRIWRLWLAAQKNHGQSLSRKDSAG